MSYVYLMRSGDRYKIGLAKDVERRWRQLRTGDPAITIEHVIRSPRASALEADLHQRFRRQRIELEWFALGPGDIAYIKHLDGGRWWVRRQRWRKIWRWTRRIGKAAFYLALLGIALYAAWKGIEAIRQYLWLNVRIHYP